MSKRQNLKSLLRFLLLAHLNVIRSHLLDYQRQTKQEMYTEKRDHLCWDKVKKKRLLCWDKGEEEAVAAATGSG